MMHITSVIRMLYNVLVVRILLDRTWIQAQYCHYTGLPLPFVNSECEIQHGIAMKPDTLGM